MTYVESRPKLNSIPNSSPLPPSLSVVSVTDIDLFGRFEARLRATLGSKLFGAFFNLLQFERVSNNTMILSLPIQIGEVQRSYQGLFDSICQAESEDITTVLLLKRSVTRMKAKSDPGINLRPAKSPRPDGYSLSGKKPEEPPPEPQKTDAQQLADAWSKVRNKYESIIFDRGISQISMPLKPVCIVDDHVDMEMQIDDRTPYCDVRAKILLECWQAVVPRISYMSVRKLQTADSSSLTIAILSQQRADFLNEVAALQHRLRIEQMAGTAASEEPVEIPDFKVPTPIDATLSDLFKEAEAKDQPIRIEIKDIQRAVSRHYGVSRSQLVGKLRTRVIVQPRQVAMYLCKLLIPRSLSEIGRRFGDRDHTTVLHAVRKIEELLRTDSVLEMEISQILRLLDLNPKDYL